MRTWIRLAATSAASPYTAGPHHRLFAWRDNIAAATMAALACPLGKLVVRGWRSR